MRCLSPPTPLEVPYTTSISGASADAVYLTWLQLCSKPLSVRAIPMVRTKEGKAYQQSLRQKDPPAAVVWQFRAALCMASTLLWLFFRVLTPGVSFPASWLPGEINSASKKLWKGSLKSVCAVSLLHRETSQAVTADIRCYACTFTVSPFLKTEGYLKKLRSIGEGNYFSACLQLKRVSVKVWYESVIN